MLPLYNTKLGAFREIIVSRATSGGRREIELNSGSLPPIPGGLTILSAAYQMSTIHISLRRRFAQQIIRGFKHTFAL